MAVFKKPYEISIWEDELIIPQNGASYYKENRIAVIGTDTMASPNKAFSPILTEKNNGEITFEFSIANKYFDPGAQAEVINPFIGYLIEERKVKLHYDGKWYDLLIKYHDEDSDSNIWVYHCTDAFVNELSKIGYNVELSNELNNNQGTAAELGRTVLKNTDWEVGESDILVQRIKEPMYKYIVDHSFEALNTDDNSVQTIEVGKVIYVFYSYIANKIYTNFQFMQEDDEDQFIYDSDNVIIGTNYRVKEFDISWIHQSLDYLVDNQGYKLVYNQLTTYDPVSERTVEVYEVEGLNKNIQVYNYKDSTYTTSDVITSYVTNGSNFNVYENGSLTGWSNATVSSRKEDDESILQKIGLTTYPNEIAPGAEPIELTDYTQIRGFLELKFDNKITNNYENTFFNSGFEDSASLINTVAKGEEYVLRLAAARTTTKHGELIPLNLAESGDKIRAVVAKYKMITEKEGATVEVRQIQKDGIILDFNGNFKLSNTFISGGALNEGHTAYEIDNVVQIPSNQCVYISDEQEYVWNSTNNRYVPLDEAPWFINYYYTITEAKESLPNQFLTSPSNNIGIFLYVDGNEGTLYGESNYVYISDIQLTKCIYDGNNEIVTVGNVPTASIRETNNFYKKPESGTSKTDLEIYFTLKDLAESLGCSESDIKPVYNENSEKILSISESHSNCFNILQSICETFECWLKIEVEHENDGTIKIVDGKPSKKVYFKEYAGKDNFAGFKYGINLNSIQRNVNSEEIVTKLIVDNVQSDYVDNGIISIRNATSNPTGEANILNFEYYVNKGLISNVDEYRKDLSIYEAQIKEKNLLINNLESEKRLLENSFLQVESKRNIFNNLVKEANEQYLEGLEEFKKVTNYDYNTYVEEYNHGIKEDNLINHEEIADIIGKIYNSLSVLNNYRVILKNIEEEYKNLKEKLKGFPTYNFSVSYVEGATAGMYETRLVLSDYLEGFKFWVYPSGRIEEKQEFESSINQKSFVISSSYPNIIYDTLVIKSLPDNYHIDEDGYELGDEIDIINGIKWFTLKPSQELDVDGYDEKIQKAQNEKDEIEKQFFTKYSKFIKEGTWSSNDYIDSNLYYLDALQVSQTSAFPKIEYSINVAEVSELEGLENYTFAAGDKSYIEDTEFFGWAAFYVNNQTLEVTYKKPDDYDPSNGQYTFGKRPAREEVIVSQVEWHLDEPESNVITVQNYKTRFEDLFQRISATIQQVQYNDATYAKTTSILDSNGTINQNLLLTSLNSIAGGAHALTSDGSVKIEKESIIIQSLTNPKHRVKIDNEGISFSEDGLNWRQAITGRGINIGAIDTNEILIGNSNNPSFRWDNYGISAYRNNGTEELYDLRNYVRFDQYGLYGIKNGLDYKASSLNDVKNKAYFGVTWDGFFIKNSYTGGGVVQITSNEDFQVIDGNNIERIKIGALEWIVDGQRTIIPQNGITPSLYGIRISNAVGDEVIKTTSDGNIEITGTINAAAGNIGGMTVNSDSLTMDTIVLEPGVGIYSTVQIDNDNAFSISDINGTAKFRYIDALGGRLGNLNVIDTITVGQNDISGDIRSVNYIADNNGWIIDSTGYAEFANAKVRGQIDAGSGNFYGMVTVGKTSDLTKPYIQIDGINSVINSSNYQDGAGYGWKINSDGDAVFNNITARGAIKTAVFEYAEIQAVGGVFLFRPSSTIKTVQLVGNDLKLTVEKPLLFKVGQWCKVSNYTDIGEATNPDITNILLNNGLTHVYQISSIVNSMITLQGAGAMVEGIDAVTTLEKLPGGALIDMGRKSETEGYDNGIHNYGIGVNSSDNTVNLPARAITLFETVIDETKEPKVTYKYRGVLGTLPQLSYGEYGQVHTLYHNYLENKQGIYTDSMYIGDQQQYLAYYEDNNGDRHLRISAKELIFGYDPDTERDVTWEDKIDEAKELRVEIDSTNGNFFRMGNISTSLIAHVYKGNVDITSQVASFDWYRRLPNGERDTSWISPTTSNLLPLTPTDVNEKAVFVCEVIL